MNTILLAIVILACVSQTRQARAQDASTDPAQTGSWDKRFIREAYQNSWIQQHIGQLTQEKSQNDRLKAAGQKIVSDYAQLTRELKNIAPGAGPIPLKLGSRNSRMLDHLAGLSGNDFDRAALRELVRYDGQTIRELDHEALRGENSALKQFALAQLPILQSDLNVGQSLNIQLKSGAREPSDSAAPVVPEQPSQ